MIGQKLIEAAGNGISTVAVAEAIDFDGTNDYLGRTSDLSGNANSYTFTFSAFVWVDAVAEQAIYGCGGTSGSGDKNFVAGIFTSGGAAIFEVQAWNTSNVRVLQLNASVPVKTFVHVLISVDIRDAAKQKIYINDQLVLNSGTANASLIDFTSDTHSVAYWIPNATNYLDGRLSNVYLDYTYRDLSVEANRRLFVTADLKPAADQASLNPILYLPMDDPTQPGRNDGTGGDFTLTGTVARSGRGPNQYNAPYSDLDGSADYLSKTSLTGITDGKQLTFSFVFNADDLSSGDFVFSINQSSSFLLYITTKASPGNGGGLIEIYAKNTSSATGLQASTQLTSVSANRNYHVVMSFDLTDTNKRHIAVNGQVQTLNVQSYLNVDLDLTGDLYAVCSGWSTSTRLDGRLGALWFNTSYIDLSVADNLAKFVTGTGIDAKPVDLGANGELPTGTSPLIYLPMYGNNAGKNYGTGGDFTVNSGPYTGARGPNEYWGNKAVFNGTTGYLNRTTMPGVVASRTVSGCFWVNTNTLSSTKALFYNDLGLRITTTTTASQPLVFSATNSTGSIILSVQTNTSSFSTGVYYFVQYCFDTADPAKRFVYINGISQSLIVSTYTNSNLAHDLMEPYIGRNSSGSTYFSGALSEFYFTTDYIDFSQEANRLKFRDAFGNPVNLTQQIEDAAIPNPAIYMRFDPASFGTNSGTGGNFTVNGTITDGGQL